jgi:shikimate kinase
MAEPIALQLRRPIVLVGMMGSGKTSIGKRLAARLGVAFVDADDEIERAADMSIPEIFAKHGEPEFRRGERRVIARLITDTPRVIATGGGAFADADTRALVLERADAVWLHAPLDVLVERTSRRDTRPLLQNGDPRDILAKLMEIREPFYQEAPLHVTSGRNPHEKTVEIIVLALIAREQRR